MLATLAVDLDDAGRFAPSWLVLTDRRLLAGDDRGWRDWPLDDALTLQHGDHAGVGHLSLHGRERRLAAWRYTLGHDRDALRLLTLFERRRRADAVDGAAGVDDEPVDEAADFGVDVAAPPSTWVLLRLWRFALRRGVIRVDP